MWNVKSAALAALVVGGSGQWLPPVTPIVRQQITRTAIIADFERRVDQYAQLHRLLEAVLPPVPYPNAPAEMRRATAQQRDAIRRGRARAMEGDVFTPSIGEYVRMVIAESCHNDFAALLDGTREEVEPLGTPRINERWPGATLTPMPPATLAALPPLPPEVEYRFAHRDFVLWDKHIDLIVDVLRDAIPTDPGSPENRR